MSSNISSINSLDSDLAMQMRRHGIWQEDCPLPLNRLCTIQIRYVDFEGARHDDGQMVALDTAAPLIANIFERLFQENFPIAKLRSVHHYAGNDEDSMADNNSSCFSHRPIEGTSLASLHSYGLAIDLNPLQNPFVVFDEEKGTACFHPSKGWEFNNRHNQKPGMVEKVVEIFAENGFFVWGGKWTTPIDYHHFQTPRGMAELLTLMDPSDGMRFFELCIAKREQLKSMHSGAALQKTKDLYRRSPKEFFNRIPDCLL